MTDNRAYYQDYSQMLKALAHPLRLQIVHGLLKQGCRNVRCMESGTGQSQSTISQHLMRLKAAGVLQSHRVGNEMYYEVANPAVASVVAALFQDKECEYNCPMILPSSEVAQLD